MKDGELIAALRNLAVETGSLKCNGCGHEHSCSTRGCAILNEAADRMQEIDYKEQTLNKLQDMDNLCTKYGENNGISVVEAFSKAFAEKNGVSVTPPPKKFVIDMG